MKKSEFVFNGKSSMDFFLTIEYLPGYATAKKQVETYTVPGRPGRLIFDTDDYENVSQTYEVWFKAPEKQDTHTAARTIANWLLGANGYRRLEDSYDPEVFRMAYFAGPADFENILGKYGRAELEFTCLPQRWVKAGQNAIDVEDGQEIYNEWQKSLPLLQISGSGAGTLQIGEQTVAISAIPSGGITIDCDTQNAYSGTINRNSLITVQNGFPALAHGSNLIEWTGGIQAVQITPRWWCV